jgi:hypothetical protein
MAAYEEHEVKIGRYTGALRVARTTMSSEPEHITWLVEFFFDYKPESDGIGVGCSSTVTLPEWYGEGLVLFTCLLRISEEYGF